jgi:DNA-binding PadR family transcriptional regulator
MSVTTAQREILELAASREDGSVTRWDVDGPRLQSLRLLTRRGYLEQLVAAGIRYYTITDKGRQAIR